MSYYLTQSKRMSRLNIPKTRCYKSKTVSKLADIVRFNKELRSDLTKADFILLFVMTNDLQDLVQTGDIRVVTIQ